MNFIIEIINNNDEVIATKKAYTIEEIKEFYKNEFRDYSYRIYEISNINIYK